MLGELSVGTREPRGPRRFFLPGKTYRPGHFLTRSACSSRAAAVCPVASGRRRLRGHLQGDPVRAPRVGLFGTGYAAAILAGWFECALRPLAGEPVWEFIERGGSGGAPLALAWLRGHALEDVMERSPARDRSWPPCAGR